MASHLDRPHTCKRFPTTKFPSVGEYLEPKSWDADVSLCKRYIRNLIHIGKSSTCHPKDVFHRCGFTIDKRAPSLNTSCVISFFLSSDIHFLISVDYSKDILFCVHNVRFDFERASCKQIDGVAMDSLLGPILDDVFSPTLEKRMHNNISQTLLYKCYDDDILIPTDPNHLITILCDFRSVHSTFLFPLRKRLMKI